MDLSNLQQLVLMSVASASDGSGGNARANVQPMKYWRKGKNRIFQAIIDDSIEQCGCLMFFREATFLCVKSHRPV
jgi:hypothetical protein